MNKRIVAFFVAIAMVFSCMAIFAACGSQTTYTVTFDANGGTKAPAALTEVESGSKIRIPDASAMEREGYTFTNTW